MSDLPEGSNFHAALSTDLPAKEVGQLLAACGWKLRKCAWTDYEAVSDYAELVLQSSKPVLVHGSVAEVAVNWRHIVEPLAAAGLSGSFECYDDEGELILEQSFGDASDRGRS